MGTKISIFDIINEIANESYKTHSPKIINTSKEVKSETIENKRKLALEKFLKEQDEIAPSTYDPNPRGIEYIEGDTIVKDLSEVFQENLDIHEYENECLMWTLQLKAFVLDSIVDSRKRNSQQFLDFLDELNKISVSI